MRKDKGTSIYIAPNWDLLSVFPPLFFERGPADSFWKDCVWEYSHLYQISCPWAPDALKKMPMVWTQEKKKRHCIVSRPSLSLSSERRPQAEAVAFQNQQISMIRKRQVYPHLLTPETSCRKWGWWKSSTQCQNSATASTAKFAECVHRLPHAPLPLEWGSSSSKPYLLYNFSTQGTIKRKKMKNNSYDQISSFSCFAAISFTSHCEFCCCMHKPVCPFHLPSPKGCIISRRTILGTIQKQVSIFSSLSASEDIL